MFRGMVLVLMLSITQCAWADSFSQFGVLVFGDFTASESDVEGRLAVGGNVDIDNYDVGLQHVDDGSNVMIVGGNVDWLNGTLNNGDMEFGGTFDDHSGSVGLAGNTATQGTNFNFAQQESHFLALAQTLANQPINGTVTHPNENQLFLQGTHPTMNVFSVSQQIGADTDVWDGLTQLDIDIPLGSTAIINVLGATVSMDGLGFTSPQGTPDVHQARTLFNFQNATHLSISNLAFNGSILAPNAAFLPSGGATGTQTNGHVVASSLSGGGQINRIIFAGSLPVAVPEPRSVLFCSLAMLMTAMSRWFSQSENN